MSENSANNKRIAKNTLMLYFRLLFTMGVSLYTSRVILDVLGVDDFGIYNVVGGVVMLLSFFSSTLSSTTQRFLNVELGKGRADRAILVFSQSFWMYLGLAILLVLIGGIIGPWFIEHKLVIPVGRETAARYVFFSSLGAVFLSILQIPYIGLIIAKERMSFYAYMGIFDVAMKLLVVFFISYNNSCDNLILYSFAIFCVHMLNAMIYMIFCRSNFEECRLTKEWDGNLTTNMFQFASFNFVGGLLWAGNYQGLNIILYLFFGPAVNAARAIAMQVNTGISNFSSNMMTAVLPQIVKSYSIGDNSQVLNLVRYSSKYSFFLMLLLSLPILFNTEYILNLWLSTVPEYSVVFIQLILIESIVIVLKTPLSHIATATGKVKNTQIYGRIIIFLTAPVAYLCLKLQLLESPIYVFVLAILTRIFAWMYILYDVNKQIKIEDYFKGVLIPIFNVALFSVGIVYISSLYLDSGFVRLILLSIISTSSVGMSIFLFGLSKTEREFLKTKITYYFHKK
ncbi:MAG: hypothetical protein R3Y26_07200 [Rikenellaceae bacterium]